METFSEQELTRAQDNTMHFLLLTQLVTGWLRRASERAGREQMHVGAKEKWGGMRQRGWRPTSI